jgi:uncharacterized membrane protein
MRAGSAGTASAAALLVGLAACAGAGSERGTDSTAARAPATVADTAVVTFHVVGNEPFWALEITASGLRFRTPEDTAGALFPRVAPSAAGDTLTWAAAAGSRRIEARLWPSACSDGMSDRVWTHRAIVRVDTTTYQGCAAQT